MGVAVFAVETHLYKASENGYKDGIYYGSANGYGGPIKVKVTIKNGKIIAVEIISATGETPSFLTMARPVTNRILQSQSPNVDGVSGATYTSNGIMNATIVALNQAGNTTFTAKDNNKEKNTSKTEQNTKKTTKNKTKDKKKNNTNKDLENAIFENGTYYGSGEGYGGIVKVSVEIKQDNLEKIRIVEASGEDAAYLSMAESMIEEMITKQTPQVDTVSGATYSSVGIWFCGYACAFGTLGDFFYGISTWVQKKLKKKLPKIPDRWIDILQNVKYINLLVIYFFAC